jgi:DNA-binding GntR family transcriptional regulator
MLRREVVFPSINLDRNSRVSLQRQIYRDIARAIQTGSLKHEARLPASRALAKILGVSRNTVVAAYEDLAAEDLIWGEPGSGMRVNGSSRAAASSSWVRDVVRTARYPERVLSIADPDGNPLYINF